MKKILLLTLLVFAATCQMEARSNKNARKGELVALGDLGTYSSIVSGGSDHYGSVYVGAGYHLKDWLMVGIQTGFVGSIGHDFRTTVSSNAIPALAVVRLHNPHPEVLPLPSAFSPYLQLRIGEIITLKDEKPNPYDIDPNTGEGRLCKIPNHFSIEINPGLSYRINKRFEPFAQLSIQRTLINDTPIGKNCTYYGVNAGLIYYLPFLRK